jgi:hypothetical protein
VLVDVDELEGTDAAIGSDFLFTKKEKIEVPLESVGV